MSTPPLLTDAIAGLAGVDDRGIWFEGAFAPWCDAVAAARARTEALRGMLDADRPPHVGVLLENTPEYLYLLCAAATSELVVVGLNETRAGGALARDVAVADCQVVLTDAAHAAALDGLDLPGVRVVRVDDGRWIGDMAGAPAREAAGASGPGPSHAIGEDDLVCLVFTSGTSGDPKAVRVTQRKISTPGRMLTERFGITRSDCIYSAMPLFHSNAIMVAWPLATFAGTSIALRRRFSASGWLDDVRRYGCTFANYVGAPLAYVLATPEHADDADNPMRIVYGNEAPADVRERFAERFGVRVVDGFGSTEGGVAVGRTPDTPAEALGPLPDGVRVVDPETGEERPRARRDPDGRLTDVDAAVGELVGDSAGLFDGYYRDPAADAERLRGGRYWTGDLAFVDPEGYVHFAGRSGGWMRVDGENLAAAPVERILRRHPAVAQVAVYGIDARTAGGSVGDLVMAAVVLAGDAGCAVGAGVGAGAAAEAGGFREDLPGFLARQPDLGPKQWPSFVRVTTSLPRTASFKVLTRELAALGTEPVAGDLVFEVRRPQS